MKSREPEMACPGHMQESEMACPGHMQESEMACPGHIAGLRNDMTWAHSRTQK